MLIDLLKYVAADGDLFPPVMDGQMDEQIPAEPETLVSHVTGKTSILIFNKKVCPYQHLNFAFNRSLTSYARGTRQSQLIMHSKLLMSYTTVGSTWYEP